MQIKTKTWFEERGFLRNPFSSEPISKDEVKTKAFIDRTEAKEDIRHFVQERSGAIIILSEIGYGKSSMMNYAAELSKDAGKTVLTIDPRMNLDKICFFKSLAQEILNKVLEKHNNPVHRSILENFISHGNDSQLHRLLQILKEIFEGNPSVLIMDDLDKLLNFKKHISFLKNILDLLPKNIQIVTTGDLNQVMNSRVIVSSLYSMFDFPIVLQEIKHIEQLKEFVYGRMGAYSLNKEHLKFDDLIFETLLDRTRGNLREAFRYMSELLKQGQYSNEYLINVIVKIDAIRLYALDDSDKRILLHLSGNKSTLKEIQSFLRNQNIDISLQMIRFRLDELHQNCWIYKDKLRDSKRIFYSAPAVLKFMIKIE